MPGLRIGVMHNTINSRYGPKPLIQADYLTGLAAGADSFWVADHLNSVLPSSMWKPKYVGAAKIIPKMDAHVEPWTMLGYLAGHNKIGRMTLGVAVTDTGRRNPAVTAQAASRCTTSPAVEPSWASGPASARATNLTASSGLNPSRASRRRWPPSERCGTPTAGSSAANQSTFPLHNATFALTPYKGKWPEIWIAAHGPRMIRAAGRYADGWFPGTTRASEYGQQLNDLRAAASNAGRDPMAITPAGIRFILTGRSQRRDRRDRRLRAGPPVHAELPGHGLGAPRRRTSDGRRLQRRAGPRPSVDR